MRIILLLTCILSAFAAHSLMVNFIYWDQFNGTFFRSIYDTSAYGYATHNGYVSVFNIDRKVIESLLPSEFKLAKISSREDVAPLVVLWGEMSDTGAYDGIDLPSGLVYRELQFYIPGVYKADSPNILRTFVPRMFVDAFMPEYLGRRFFYRKIQLDSMPFDLNKGMEAQDWVSLKVLSSGKASPGPDYQDKKWGTTWTFLPNSDIMGEQDSKTPPRCSGFEWQFPKGSTIAPANVTMQIHKPLIDGMDTSIIDQTLTSVATFQVKNWYFMVDYHYNNCEQPN
jgi:hypothetical protein